MGELDLHRQEFEINVSINGAHKIIKVSPDETSDGIEYFNCILNGKNITQIRAEEGGKWEQIWGELDQETVNTIGAAIKASN